MGTKKKDSNELQKLICGVEIEFVEKFLLLIRDRYPLADKANYFLELNARTSGINIAIANQRDFLSHLCTLLSNPELSEKEKLAQLNTAEEHLRRACMEPYAKAVSLILRDVFTLFGEYKKTVLPLKKVDSTFTSAPHVSKIEFKLKEINRLREKGREAKRRNIWDKEWEEGQKSFIEAYEESHQLLIMLEDYLIRAQNTKTHDKQITMSKKQKYLQWWAIIATIIGVILSLILFL